MSPVLPIPVLLAWRSLRRHAVSSICALLLLAFAAGGALAANSLRTASARAFAAGVGPFDAILAARGSPLQIVLASLYHMEAAPGLVPAAEMERIAAHPAITHALPLVIGDNHQGWRLVGTHTGLFDHTLWSDSPNPPRLAPGGRIFNADKSEIVAGSQAAAALGLKVGDHLSPAHGLDHSAETVEDHAHEEEFTVVGLLAPTGTPLDRVLWAPAHALQHLAGHDPAHAHDFSAILVRFRPDAGIAGYQLAQSYNRPDGSLTLAWPVAAHVAALFERFAWTDRLLGVAAVFSAFLSALCVIIALHSSLDQRRRDWAILRAIGASARALGLAIVAEALLLGASGALGALLVATTLQSLVAWQVRVRTGMTLPALPDSITLLVGTAGLIIACALAALGPARAALRSPVAENMVPRA